MFAARVSACLVLLVLILPPVVTGQSDTFAVVSPWVVAVLQPAGKTIALGSGFVSSNGYVVTAAHVIDSEKLPIFLAIQGDLTPDRMRSAKVVHIDRDSDIAILDGGYTPPVGLLAQQTPAATGDEVWIFGYEFIGTRAAILRIARGSIGQRFKDTFQLDGPVQRGFSGGPITTRGGRVVGIVSFGFRESQPNLSYIVPDKLVQDELNALGPKTPPTTASGSIIPPLPETRPTTPPVIRDTSVMPGQRLGPLTLTTSLSQMSTILGGPPDSSNETSTGRNYTWKKYGVMAFLDTGGIPAMLATWNPAFSTIRGIRVGMSADAAERTYGLNYQTQWSQDQSLYSITYPGGLSFIMSASTRTVAMIAVARPTTSAEPSAGQGVPGLTGTFIGNYTATVQPGAVYEGVFQITQNGNTIVGSITTNSGRAGNIVGVVAGSRINATMTFTDACGGRASAIIKGSSFISRQRIAEALDAIGKCTASSTLGIVTARAENAVESGPTYPNAANVIMADLLKCQ